MLYLAKAKLHIPAIAINEAFLFSNIGDTFLNKYAYCEVIGVAVMEERFKLYHILVAHKSFYDAVLQDITNAGGTILHDWDNFPLLVSAELSDALFAQLSADARIVACREPEKLKRTDSYTTNLGNVYGKWGIDRIDQRTPFLNQKYSVTADGRLPGNRPVNVFIVDSGVQRNHQFLKYNIAAGGWDAFRLPSDPLYTWPEATSIYYQDAYGNFVEHADDHGTHVASIVLQVAPNALIWPVRVFGGRDGSFTTDTIFMQGINWIISAHKNILLGGNNPSVVNMSLGANNRPDALWNYVIRALIDNGITVCVAAGNDNMDAYYTTPAGVGVERVLQNEGLKERIVNIPANGESDYYHKPITVGACSTPVSQRDKVWAWNTYQGSNWGDVVDVFAPGDAIYGASFPLGTRKPDPAHPGHYYYDSNFANDSTAMTKTGTSMATPVFAGICALWLSAEPALTHFQIRQKINERSTKGVFFPDDMANDRMDNFAVDPATIANPQVFSPNLLAYTWLVPTTLTWDAAQHDYTIASDSHNVYWIAAESLNHNGEYEPVDYYLDSGSTLPSWVVLTTSAQQIQPGVYKNLLGINVTTQRFDAVADFYVWATDHRSPPVKTRIIVTAVLTHEKPKWISPPSGNLLGYNPDGSDKLLYTGTVINIPMSAQQEPSDVNPIDDYEIIPTVDALPLGLTWDGNSIKGTGGIYHRGSQETFAFSVKAINDYNLSTIRQFYIKVHQENLQHSFDPTWLSGLQTRTVNGTTVYELATLSMGESLGVQLQLINPDNDTLSYDIGPLSIVNVELQPNFISNGVLPLNSRQGSAGYIGGVISGRISAGDYYFRAIVCDAEYCTYQNFVVTVKDNSVVTPNPGDYLEWVTPEGDLGDTYETYYSHFGVLAKNPQNAEITYTIVANQSQLPAGVTIDSKRGYILGLMPFVTGNTKFTFTVKASLGNNSITRQFWFTVRELFTIPAIINISAYLFGYERIDLQHWTWLTKQIPLDSVFRHGDEFFGRQMHPTMYVISGLNLVYSKEIFGALKDYHNNMNLQLGEVGWAKANDAAGNYAYDVVYIEVVDNLKRAGGFSVNPTTQQMEESDVIYPHRNLPTGNKLIFPGSISNVRNDLSMRVNRSARTRPMQESNVPNNTTIGLNGREALPLWMQTVQKANTPPPGFKAVIPIAYLKPGKGAVVKEALKMAGINKRFSGRKFGVDRWYISSVGSLLTTFDNGTTTFDNNTTVFDDIPALVGKFYKFPPGDKVIK